MKKTTLILSALVLLSSPAFACPGSEHKAVDFNTKVKFSAARIVNSVSFKSAKTFNVKGMHCNSCVKKVEGAISGIEGVKSVKVDLKNSKALIVYKPNVDQKAISAKITKAVEKSGFKASKV